jgi:hypothetical protein
MFGHEMPEAIKSLLEPALEFTSKVPASDMCKVEFSLAKSYSMDDLMADLMSDD